MKKIVIFGIGKIAEVIYYYATKECGLSIVAFCVDEQYKNVLTFQGLPVISFSDVDSLYAPSQYDMFIAVGYHDLNSLRKVKCIEAQQKGYHLVSVISPLANLPSNVSVGWNCFIPSPSIIHPCVKIGNNVFVWSGALVGHHSILEDHCWLTSSCSISGNVIIGANTFVAVNATVGHNVSIGSNCFLGANTLVTKNLENDKVVIEETNKPIRLSSRQFLRMSSFSSL